MSDAINFFEVEKKYSVSKIIGTKEITAFSNLSFSIQSGEIAALLGLNGAGKTTIMKLIAGLLFCNKGKIEVFGGNPASKETKKKIGFLPELPYFSPAEKPINALKFYGSLSGLSGKELQNAAEETINLVGLAPHKNKKIGQFSKGMLQRLGLAQAILHKPSLLLLDEPVSGLDPLAIRDIRHTLSKLAENGTTILMSSHSISEVEKICTRALILKEGKLAKTIKKEEWENSGLEEIFIKTVSEAEK